MDVWVPVYDTCSICKSRVDSFVSTAWPQGVRGSFESIFKCLTKCQLLHSLFPFAAWEDQVRGTAKSEEAKNVNHATESVEQNRTIWFTQANGVLVLHNAKLTFQQHYWNPDCQFTPSKKCRSFVYLCIIFFYFFFV